MNSKERLEDIIKEYSPDLWTGFFRSKSPFFAPRKESLKHYQDDYFTDITPIGTIKKDPYNIFIAAIRIVKDLSERSSRKAQYDKAKEILRAEDIYDGGIFIFYDATGNFRFSLVYEQHLGTRRTFSNFRRFTYFVSQELTNNTFKNRIGLEDFSSFDKIKEAFSVEKVTDKFFEEFRKIFEKTKAEFEKTNKNTVCLWLKDRYPKEEYHEHINKFAFIFLGRLIFIYFLQRKGWIENHKNFIRNVIKDDDNCNLYFSFFQPLFFEVFAKKENERTPEIKKQYKDTPYLNGGLFERSELEVQLEKAGVFILFDDKFIRDIVLNFFEAYNFTIDENLPDDKEVSIDPEMLGKVFENTLAEEERGKKGTFYTPREIVHFMVKDSLLQFLLNETSIEHNKLHCFIYHDDFNLDNLTKEQIRQIDSLLEEIKILDPAVGSAAFPVEMMHVLVNLRKKLDVRVGKNVNEITLKKQFIKNNLYGVDIDPGAIEIAKLRLWLALIVDYNKSEAEPLPNLDFQFRVGNSLQEKVDGLDIFNEVRKSHFSSTTEFEKVKDKMIKIKNKFYDSENEAEKRKLKNEFDDLEHRLINAVLDKYRDELTSQFKNVKGFGGHKIASFQKSIKTIMTKMDILGKKIKDGTYKLFKPDFHFSEVFDRKDKDGKKINGFDVVIGNPPYGVKVDDDIKDWHGLGSKDSYGVFISTSLKRFLKEGGILSFIVSDTFLTIKTHLELRQQILSKQLHKIIRFHQDCFEATVNACIMGITNKSDDDEIIAADLTNISTRKEVDELREKLYHLESFIGQATPVFAIYKYNQNLIKTNSNYPIFVGSPKLFLLMNNTAVERLVFGEAKQIKIRKINFNGKPIELVRFGDIAEIRQGLATGDNDYYLFQNPEARGNYKNINEYRKYLLKDGDLNKIISNETIRLKVVEKGLHKLKNEKCFDEDLWFEGRYIVPYDKGGESDTDTGWLPNYYVPTNYFIDWSCEAVRRLNELTIRDRDGKGKEVRCAVMRSPEYYFKKSITASRVGEYSPTFRKGTDTLFDSGCSNVFTEINRDIILGIVCSKLFKWFFKLGINHTVNSQVDDMKEIPFVISENNELAHLVNEIIKKQKQNSRYDYMSNEQKEIDKLVYEIYGLDRSDIQEVETWYARRYPKLAGCCDLS